MNRFIAKVTIFDDIAYQTKNFQPNIYLGDPVNIINMLGDQGAQEVFISFADQFNPKLAENLLTVCRMPVSLAGYIGEKALALGADKYVVGYSGSKNIDQVKIMSEALGVQAVALSLDYVVQAGKRQVVTGTQRNAVVGSLDQILEYLDLSIYGELVLNSVDRDGSGEGVDLDVVKLVPDHFRAPVLLAGGGVPEDVENDHNVGIVSCSSVSLVGPKKAVLVNYPEMLSVR